MFESPEPLPEGTAIDYFTPDASLSWLVAYAGPCGVPECKLDGMPNGHTRLYLIPMVGWLHAVLPKDEISLRPAIMSSGGAVVDYLNVAPVFRFIAVIRATEDAGAVARGLYEERHRETGTLIVERTDALQN